MKVDEFEYEHNFKYEHGISSIKAKRNTEDTLRNKEPKRATQRESKKERLEDIKK